MKGLVIIGARGFGREVSEAAKDCIGFGTEFVVKGFLDDDPHALDTTPGYPPILGPVEDYQPAGDDVFACGLGDPRWQKHYADIILQKGGRFINLIHRTATIGKNTVLGSGCIILRGVDISCDITLGDFVTCQAYVVMGHDVRIGSFCHVGARSFFGGYSRVGDLTTIHPGSGILPHVTVGNGCVVGAGSVVIKKVKDGETIYGNPAKVLKF